MPGKRRGRPVSTPTGNPQRDKVTLQNRLAKQRERERKAQALRYPVNESQTEQSDHVIEQTELQLDDPEPTVVSLGLRLTGLSLNDLDKLEDRTEAAIQRNLFHNEQQSLNALDSTTSTYNDRVFRTSQLPARHTTSSIQDDGLGRENLSKLTDRTNHTIYDTSDQYSNEQVFDVANNLNQFLDAPRTPSRVAISPGSSSDSFRTPLTDRTRRSADPVTEASRRAPESSSLSPLEYASHTPIQTPIRDTPPVDVGDRSDRHNRLNTPQRNRTPSPLWSSTTPTQTSEYVSEEEEETDTSASGSEDEDNLPSTARKIFAQLCSGFHGCSAEEHHTASAAHHETIDQQHRVCSGLDSVSHDRAFPSVLANDGFLTRKELEFHPPPEPEQWESMFCGNVHGSTDAHIRPVCLHYDDIPSGECRVTYDIDSFLGFASSLAFAKQGIEYQPAPQYRQNINSDIHLQMHTYVSVDPTDENFDETQPPPTPVLKQLQHVPHFFFGRAAGILGGCSIYILFPHLEPMIEDSSGLTESQLQRWTNDIFLPAIHEFYPRDHLQHIPGNYQHAVRNSAALQVEGRVTATASYQTRQAHSFFLEPKFLEEVWDAILRRIQNTPGARIFRDAQIFFSGKGTKLHYKRPSLTATLKNFKTSFQKAVSMEHVFQHRMYIDIGKEIYSHSSDRGNVLLWKRCCLERYMQWMYEQSPPSLGSEGYRLYSVSMLHDAANLTSVTPKTSKLRQGGLVYSQFYGSVKEVIDATKQYPFQNDGLEELALDPTIIAAARKAEHGRKQTKVIEAAYCASKARLNEAIRACISKFYGCREEHRCTWLLLEAIEELSTTQDALTDSDGESTVTIMTPNFTWCIPTRTYLPFLKRNANKFAAGFEIARLRDGGKFVSWERTKVMAMFLRCLRYCLAGHQFQRENALWLDQRRGHDPEGREVIRVGLGFGETLHQHGYAWLKPRVDWNKLKFFPEITDDMIFGNQIFKRRYLKHGGKALDFFDQYRQADTAIHFIKELRERNIPQGQKHVMQFLVHICLRQMRIDMIKALSNDIDPHHLLDAETGRSPFSLDYFRSIVHDSKPVRPMRSRTDRQPNVLAAYLFTDRHEGKPDVKWKGWPFRALHAYCAQGLSTLPHGDEARRTFKSLVLKNLWRYHWVIPNPVPNTLADTNKKVRSYYSVRPIGNARPDDESLNVDDWCRYSEKGLPGYPPSLPVSLSWSKERWQDWFTQQIGQAPGIVIPNVLD